MGIKIYVRDAAELSQKECIALGKMFMHLGGCELTGVDPAVPGADKSVVWDNLKNKLDKGEISLPPLFGNANDTTPAPVTIQEVAETVAEAAMNTISPPPTPVLAELISTNTEIDADGIAWDERIHAKNRAKTAKGTWKLGRNISPTFLKSVKAELKRAVTVPPVSVSVSAYVPIVPPVGMPAIPAPIPLPPVAAPVPMPVAEVDPYDALITRIQEANKTGKLQIATIMNRVKQYGLENLIQVQDRPDVIPLLMADLDVMIAV